MLGSIYLLVMLSFRFVGSQQCEADDCHNHQCDTFDSSRFSSSRNASVFLIAAQGRLGNHLMAYSLAMALAKVTGIQGRKQQHLGGGQNRHINTYYQSLITRERVEIKSSACPIFTVLPQW
jgi:hypothetical protein